MIQEFIQTNFLKKEESIEKIEQQDNLFLVTVVRKTSRTLRKVAQLKITMLSQFPSPMPKKLAIYKMTPNTKRKLNETNETIYEWLQQGWIVREIRYHIDGISVKDDYYRIGPATVQSLQLEQQKLLAQEQRHMEQLQTKAKQLKLPALFEEAIEWQTLPEKWTVKKRLKYIQFCLAFYELSQQKDLFDFKEIGATWKDAIGGSKVFDLERESFLQQLEQSSIDPSIYGLVSMGKIVPIFFTGHLHNELATYTYGAVHATTDNAVLQSPFSTTNTTLWLVENRAILTRMATEVEFLQQSNSFILCLDGQIRSAHKQLIGQLLQSSIQQTIIWTDTDMAGLTIAKHAAALVNGQLKIIGRNFVTYASIESYEQQALEQQPHEQEQQLGGVAEWRKWI